LDPNAFVQAIVCTVPTNHVVPFTGDVTLKLAASLLTIVPTPWAFVMVAFEAPLKLTVNVRSEANAPSLRTGTAIVCVVVSGENVMVPEVVV
jgi:hypothetical protein